MAWEPITGLGEDWPSLTTDELRTLGVLWQEQRDSLDTEGLVEFNERLAREWSIETGIIEGIYTLDRGTTQMLVERGLDATIIPHEDPRQTPEMIMAHILDHREAVNWLFDAVTSWESSI